jgi:hypothetical protein
VPKTDPNLEIWVEELKTSLEKLDYVLGQLAPQVVQWFQRATSQFKAPSDDACRSFAFYLLAFRDSADDKEPDHRKEAIRYGRLFLHHIKPERRHIERMISAASRGTPFGDWLQQYQDMLSRIDEIQRHMDELLPALSPKQDAKPDVIRKLASVAQEAWAGANEGRYPRSTNPNDPLCRFLVEALKAIGQERTPAAISKVLKGLRRTR